MKRRYIWLLPALAAAAWLVAQNAAPPPSPLPHFPPGAMLTLDARDFGHLTANGMPRRRRRIGWTETPIGNSPSPVSPSVCRKRSRSSPMRRKRPST